MEIGSLNGMQSGMDMQRMGRRPPMGDPAEHAEKMSAKIMEEQDSDGDGQLSSSEFDSELLANLDEDGDGILSQAELQTGLQTAMEEGKAAFESGGQPSAENREFMQQMHSMAGGPPPGNRAKASQAYSMMQEKMSGGFEEASSYNTDQMLLEQLNMAV